MSNRLRAALTGGVVIGALSAITVIPQVPFIRLVCCVWAIVGGALAAYLYIKKSPVPATVGDGAIVGTLAGVVGSLIAFAALMLVSFYLTDRTLVEEQIRQAGLNPERFSFSLIIMLTGVLAILLQICLSLVGGIVGVSIFEQRGDGGAGPQPPPPPPYYGGPGDTNPPPPPPPGAYGPET
ncbi:MAG TPA: DUF5518 domain-containing protein [Pyrinomonadaceae bacterium]|nr:DUF5518 domain-containing protein [Pyrinomonadaceae bacterium]